MKKFVCWKNTKTKSPTIVPHFALKLKGRIDGKKGIGTIDSTIEKLYKKEASIEAEECVICENFLTESRKSAAKLLKSIEVAEKQICSLPDEMTGTDFDIVRINRRNTNTKNSAQATISSSIDRLCEINQEIISVETILEERIKKTRDKSAAKIEAYISGVRLSLSDYSSRSSFDDQAYNIYLKKHEALDSAIRSKVETSNKKEVSYNENI